MGIAGSPDFFQAKMAELMESLENVQGIDDLLCISRDSLEDPLEILEEVLRQLRDAGLKVKADKSTFCALEIEYLGYILTTMALLTIEIFLRPSFENLPGTFQDPFQDFYRGTVDFRHMGVQVSRKYTNFYGGECSEVFF